MVLAIAFESLVKLLAFLAVGVFVTYGLYNGFGDLIRQAKVAPQLDSFWQRAVNWPSMLVQTGLAMMAIICLPRQFHVTVVENTEAQDLRLARWVFPAYLLLAALFVIPIALAGQMLLPSGVMADSFVISLPLAEAHPALALLAFIGGASAATGMVIVASVALSTMVSNDMLLPWLLRRQTSERPFEVFRHWMLSVRRISIVLILLLAYVCYRLLGSSTSLATIGQIAFAAITQLAPAMLGALYWKQANRRGVFAGLTAGALLWFYTLVLPLVAQRMGWPLELFPALHWLANQPLGLPIDPLTLGVVLALAGNWLVFAWSRYSRAPGFLSTGKPAALSAKTAICAQVTPCWRYNCKTCCCWPVVLLAKNVPSRAFSASPNARTKRFNPAQAANSEWIAHTERLLASVLGASSTRAVVKAAIEGREMQVEDVVRIVGEASRGAAVQSRPAARRD